MTKTEQDQALAKARKSVAEHMAKMKKTVSDNMDKMVKLHKAHADEMQDNFTKLHKILGTEELDSDETSKSGTNEPETIDPKTQAAPDHRAEKTVDNGELLKTLQSMEKRLTDMQSNFDQQLEKGVNEGLQYLLGEMIKAEGSEDDCPECAGSGKKGEEKCEHCMGKGKKAQKAAPASGIGNRNDPVLFKSGPAIRVMPVAKHQDYNNPSGPQQPSQQQAPNPDDVRKASQGDVGATLRLMKGATPSAGMPVTLAHAGVLQK